MHNRPSNQILPHSDTPFCLCKPKEIMNAHQTRHENPAKKNYFYTALGVRNSAFTLLVVVFQQLWLVQFDPCCLTQWFAPSAVPSLSAVGLRRSTSNINYLFYHWASFDFIRSFINKLLNNFQFKQLLIHTWCLSFYVLLEIEQRILWKQSNIILRIEHNLTIVFDVKWNFQEHKMPVLVS